MYFLTPRKCGIFGVCCEGLPQQVNYLVDEGMAVSKGSVSVINFLDHFFGQYGVGETHVDLHCDNCSGQNKNRYMLNYLCWRTLNNLHEEINLHFLIAGHTKFAPDWCFGLVKQAYRRTKVGTIDDICKVVRSSTPTGINVAQPVGLENGTVFVEYKNFNTVLEPFFRPLPRIKSYQHFR